MIRRVIDIRQHGWLMVGDRWIWEEALDINQDPIL
jgi:hypothetical protein